MLAKTIFNPGGNHVICVAAEVATEEYFLTVSQFFRAAHHINA
jgi:hypothetical protein